MKSAQELKRKLPELFQFKKLMYMTLFSDPKTREEAVENLMWVMLEDYVEYRNLEEKIKELEAKVRK